MSDTHGNTHSDTHSDTHDDKQQATKKIQQWASDASYVLRGAGAELYYEVVGPPDAPALFYLHGGPGYNSYSFRELVGEELQHYRVIYADQRGAGRSLTDDPATSLQLEVLAEDVLHICNQLELQDVMLLAHGFGAMIALTLAYHAPDALRGMVLFNPWLDMPTLAARIYQFSQNIAQLTELPEGHPQQWVLEASQQWGGKSLFDALFFASPQPRMQLEHIDATSGIFFRHEAEDDAPLWEISVTALLEKIQTPTILMVGQQDKSCYPDQAEILLSKMPHALVSIVEGGHYPWLDAADFEQLLQESLVMLRRQAEENEQEVTSGDS